MSNDLFSYRMQSHSPECVSYITVPRRANQGTGQSRQEQHKQEMSEPMSRGAQDHFHPPSFTESHSNNNRFIHHHQQVTVNQTMPQINNSLSDRASNDKDINNNDINTTQEVNIARWDLPGTSSSLNPASCVQVQPIEMRCTSDGDRIYTEHGHKMVVDGDAYTLVILECSPRPGTSDGALENVSLSQASGSRSNSSRLGQANCCDCQSTSGCHCHSELLVRQMSHEHHHGSNCSHQGQPQSQDPKQQYYVEVMPSPGPSTSIKQRDYSDSIDETKTKTKTTTTTTTTDASSKSAQSNSSNNHNRSSNRQDLEQENWEQSRGYQRLEDESYMSDSNLSNRYNYNYNQSVVAGNESEYQSNFSNQLQSPNKHQEHQHLQVSYGSNQRPNSGSTDRENVIYSSDSSRQNLLFSPGSSSDNQFQAAPGRAASSQTSETHQLSPSLPNQQQHKRHQPQQQQQQQQQPQNRIVRFSEADSRLVTSATDETGNDDQFDHKQQQQRTSPRPTSRADSLGSRASSGSQTRGTKVVKRWDWNQAQFVETEVPDVPVTRPPPGQAIGVGRPGPGGSSYSLSPNSARLFEIWNEEMSPIPAAAANNNNSEQPWLDRRIPDIASIQADPLYRDLLFELQRLEEGPQVVRAEPPGEPECSQRPVFGQSVQPESLSVSESEPAEFVCRLIPSSDPSMRVQWLRNGQPLQDSNRMTNEFEFGVARLHIRRCEPEDAGVYQCVASNGLGQATSTCSLRVHASGNIQRESLHPAGLEQIRRLEEPPAVREQPQLEEGQAPKFLSHIADYVEKDEGESVHFECCLGPVDDPELKTEWFFNGRPLVTGSRFHTIDDFGFIVLDIDWLFPRDTGEYVCRATNKHGQDITRTVLRVRPDRNIVLDSQLDNPQIIDKLRQLEFPDVPSEPEPAGWTQRPARFVQQLNSTKNKRDYEEGDTCHMEARVAPADDGSLEVEWLHNGRPLISGHRFKPSFDFGHIVLDILYVYPEDAGLYQCVARNSTGTDVSEFEIKVSGKPSLVYISQLPKEMVGGVAKIEEMEAMWNRIPSPEEDKTPVHKYPPQFKLKPKPCTAFEGSCARFSCQLIANPRPRITWILNGQQMVSGQRCKLTQDGMYHLTIPKCQLSDAGKLEVHARNPLGECLAHSELKVKRKVDDYRGVLKNSPNPWYDEQTLKSYRRHRPRATGEGDLDQDIDDHDVAASSDPDDPNVNERLRNNFHRLQMQMSGSADARRQHQQQVGYMEPETPDVNLLASSPLIRLAGDPIPAGDLHPAVAKKQEIKAPAPSTVGRAFHSKDAIPVGGQGDRSPVIPARLAASSTQSNSVGPIATFGLVAPPDQIRTGGSQRLANERISSEADRSAQMRAEARIAQRIADEEIRAQQLEQQKIYRQQVHHQQQLQTDHKLAGQSQSQQLMLDSRLPPASPESTIHGREVHHQTHKQTQRERRANREIHREIIEKETFEKEHKGQTKESVVRGSSTERGSTPTTIDSYSSSAAIDSFAASPLTRSSPVRARGVYEPGRGVSPSNTTTTTTSTTTGSVMAALDQQVAFEQQQALGHSAFIDLYQSQSDSQNQLLLDQMVPPEFVNKIQPCQAIDGDQAQFECTFVGDPRPTITWLCNSQPIKASNLYSIQTDYEASRSRLIIKRVSVNNSGVYSVKADNPAGSARSSANLVVEAHPRPSSARAGQARQVDESSFYQTQGTIEESSTTSYDQRVKSVRTRKMSPDEMTTIIRASPDSLLGPNFLQALHETRRKIGELARLDVRLLGSQPIEVRWLKDGQRIRPDRGHKMVLEGDLYTLLILECSASDDGYYECLASNMVGEARCGAHLYVGEHVAHQNQTYEQQQFQHPAQQQVFASGFRSSSSSSTQAKTSGSRTSTGGSSLATSNVQAGSGEYLNEGQKMHFNTSIKQQYAPIVDHYTSINSDNRPIEIPKLIKGLENQTVLEGKSVTLRCQISSYPIAQVAWFKGRPGQQIKPSKYFRILKDNDETYCLKILEAFPEDQAEYRCVAKAPNCRAQVETSAMLTVLAN